VLFCVVSFWEKFKSVHSSEEIVTRRNEFISLRSPGALSRRCIWSGFRDGVGSVLSLKGPPRSVLAVVRVS
jgi:hypothetical protein